MSFLHWEERFLNGEVRALGRLISLAENGETQVYSFLAREAKRRNRSVRVGLSGPPGAGKSTLTASLIRQFRQQGKSVAVIAVDPVSPFSGGAILGDRIRLGDFFNDERVYIRSLSTRGKLGGLSLATHLVADLCDVFGFDIILVESVGVGQSEVEIRDIVDAVAVVLVPEWGDSVQAIKAGILEIGDFFVVNKADREGAERVASELRAMLGMAEGRDCPVLLTQSDDPRRQEDFFRSLEQWLIRQKDLISRRRAERGGRVLAGWIREALWRDWLNRNENLLKQAQDPYEGYLAYLAQR